jgi:hypothetical protein
MHWTIFRAEYFYNDDGVVPHYNMIGSRGQFLKSGLGKKLCAYDTGATYLPIFQ